MTTEPGDERAGIPARRIGSVLFLQDGSAHLEEVEPTFFRDLNLDQVVEAMVAGREGYDLKPFFYTPASRAEVRHRQAVMGDLEIRSVLEHVTHFAATMRRMGEHVRRSAKLHYRYQQEAVFLQAAELYVKAVTDLARDLATDPLRSEGMTGFRDYLTGYVASPSGPWSGRRTRSGLGCPG